MFLIKFKKYLFFKKKIIDQENKNLEKSLNILIRDAEKNLSTHIENVNVLYDSSKFFSIRFFN